ncbi:suppressor of fused domain protein [Bremerella cremea]|uniref:suppressor of fused domain protein n=1 Tax=Bremerella cremea TaxID=1031537 RepID=UPI0031EAF0AB
MTTTYRQQLQQHYAQQWSVSGEACVWSLGPTEALNARFQVLKFASRPGRAMVTYATCGMSSEDDEAPLELHLFAPYEDELLVELLYAVAYYHQTTRPLGLGHTVNFGRPWLATSHCTHGLLSLPYLDGPQLEWLSVADAQAPVRCLWLVPITLAEKDFAREFGVDALEQKWEEAEFNYLDPLRASVV